MISVKARLRRIGPKRWFSPLWRKVGKHVVRGEIRRFATAQRTLDLGCGNAPGADDFPNRIGMDIARASGAHVIADAHFLPFPPGTFDTILCSEVLEHLTDPERAVREMARVLASGGKLVLTTPFVYPIHEAPHDYRRFTFYGLKRLFQPVFEIREIKSLYSEEQTIAILIQRIAFQREDSPLRRHIYLLFAHLIYRLLPASGAQRYQGLDRDVEGPFLTAGYLLIAEKREGTARQ